MSTFSLSLEEADRIVAQLQTTPHKDQPRAPSQASLLPEEEITAILDSIVTPPPTKHIQQSPAGKKPKLSHVPLHIESLTRSIGQEGGFALLHTPQMPDLFLSSRIQSKLEISTLGSSNLSISML